MPAYEVSLDDSWWLPVKMRYRYFMIKSWRYGDRMFNLWY